MTAVNAWTIAATAAAFALLASLRLSLPAREGKQLGTILNIATHPAWLLPFILVMGMAIGLMVKGMLSPWPPEAAQQAARIGGWWGGATGFLVVLIVDGWLLWTGSCVMLRFSTPEQRRKVRLLPVLNFALGALFLSTFYLMSR